MRSEAMYVGKRRVKRNERRNEETGEVIPPFNGWQYMFYCAEWDGDEVFDMGRTRYENVELDEEEEYEKDLNFGEIVTVSIRENFRKTDYTCKRVRGQ